MSEQVNIYVEICREGAIVPRYAHEGDAGMDVYAAENVVIEPGKTKIVPTGIKVAIPVGYEIQVRPRSGVSLNTPLRLPNSPGTIDSGYRDEIGVLVHNSSETNSVCGGDVYSVSTKGNINGVYEIKKGDRIAQLVLKRVPVINFIEVEDVTDIGENRGGGFGSSGYGKIKE